MPVAPLEAEERPAENRRTFPWLALLLTIPALLPLAAPGYFFNAHDAHHSVFFLVEFDQAIRDGVLWPVWGPDHAIGFGYPLWLLYAPLAYYIAEFFHLLGLGFVAAVKATWALSFLIGGWGMYRLARRWWGPAAGLLASLAFTYAPYHLVQIYVRAALAEFAALAWLPWVLLAFDALWEDPRPRRSALAALALAALLLTHTVSALIFAPLVGGFLLVKLLAPQSSSLPFAGAGGWLRAFLRQQPPQRALPAGNDRARSALWTGGALALGAMLAAIFLLPMLLERSDVVEGQWVADTYNYARHFVYPGQLLSPYWGSGYSVPGPGDGLSFQVGLLPFLGAVLGAAGIFARGMGGRRPESVFLLAASLLTAVAMTPVAKPLWDMLPLVGLIQFPWRLLAITGVTLALLTGRAVLWLDRTNGQPMATVTGQADTGPAPAAASGARPGPYAVAFALMVVLASFPYIRPELLPVRPQDESPLAVIEFETQHPDMRGMTRWSDRMPADADSPLLAQYRAAWEAPATLRLERAAIVGGQGAILEQSSAAASAQARVRAETEVRLRFYTYYFPGWTATVDGRPVEISPDPPNGLIGLTVSPGEHEVRLRFGSTPLRRAGAALSAAALAAVVALFAADRRRRPPMPS